MGHKRPLHRAPPGVGSAALLLFAVCLAPAGCRCLTVANPAYGDGGAAFDSSSDAGDDASGADTGSDAGLTCGPRALSPTIWVDDSASPPGDGMKGSPFADLQSAIDACAGTGGGVIDVAEGTYGPILLASGCTLIGWGQGCTVIDAGGAGRAVSVPMGGPGTGLSDLSITGGLVTVAGGNGAGLLLEAGSLSVNTVRIFANSTLNLGGGVFVGGGAVLTLINSIVETNQAGSGGGLSIFSSTLNMQGCIVRDNVAQTDGGGIFGPAASLAIEGSTLSGNDAGASGGGIWASSNSLDLLATTVTENSAGLDGGGIFLSGVNALLEDTDLETNVAGDNGGGLYQELFASTMYLGGYISGNNSDEPGAGVYLEESLIAGINLMLVDNHCGPAGGGGLYAEDGATVVLTFSTISDNDVQGPNSGVPGLGLFCDPGVVSVIHDVIVWKNGDRTMTGNAVDCDISWSIWQAGGGSSNNIDTDPLFVDPNTDFHLQCGSPAIDAGDPAGTPPGEDVDGQTRDMPPDLGADELTGCP